MKALLTLSLLLLAAGCVPSQSYEDQKVKLKETEEKLREVEEQAKDCDPNEFIQLKEQAQSLDLLSQELVDRNTELSKEVSRLRSVETICKSDEKDCVKKLEAQKAEFEAKIERTQKTYEDLIRELRAQVKKAEEALERHIEASKALQKAKESKPANGAVKPKAPAAAKPAPAKEAPKAAGPNGGTTYKAQDLPEAPKK